MLPRAMCVVLDSHVGGNGIEKDGRHLGSQDARQEGRPRRAVKARRAVEKNPSHDARGEDSSHALIAAAAAAYVYGAWPQTRPSLRRRSRPSGRCAYSSLGSTLRLDWRRLRSPARMRPS